MKNLHRVFKFSFLQKLLKNKKLVFFALILFLMQQYSCNTTEPPPPKEEPPKAIKLKLLDVSCTEAFIKVTAADSVLPVAITLKKDNTALFSFTLTKTDTVVVDTMLQPSIIYTYQTTAQIKGKQENSDTIQVKTLPTTSHNFTWQIWTFGGTAGSSTLYDVAIISENDIWAVGEIYVADTSQNGYTMYNAAHWDGQGWELKRISVDYNGNNITPPLYGVFAFSANDIWLSSGVPVHGDGTNWNQYHLFDMGVLGQNDGYLTKIWGNSTNDLYYTGTLGTIAHYQNGVWSKVESGTDWNIRDIRGFKDQYSNSLKILSAVFSQSGAKILSISQNSAKDTLNWMTTKGLGSLWFDEFHLFASGSGIWRYKNNSWSKMNYLSEYFLSTIRGDKINNLFAIGWLENVIHFDGVSWQKLVNVPTGTNFEGVAVKNGKVVTVGFSSSGGVVGAAVICMATAQ